MKVFCCQFDIAWEDKPANFERVRKMLAAARPPARSLVLLPEMFATGFSMDVPRIAEADGGPTDSFLVGMADELQIDILAGVVRRGEDARGSNEAVGFDTTGRAFVRYQKLHPFTFGGEAAAFRRGERVQTISWQGVKVSPFICYDLRFPEVFRVATRQGAELLAVIANWPASRESHWVTLLRARAIENQAYVAAVNRCGSDPNVEYSGRSLIVDPRGEILADGGNREGVISAEIDIDGLRSYRRQFPVLGDMRSEFFGDVHPCSG